MTETARRAKIVCTIGPASSSDATLGKLVAAGMNVARLNLSHGSHEEHTTSYRRIRARTTRHGQALGVLLDLQGPKLRLGDLAEPIKLRRGQRVVLVPGPTTSDPEQIPVAFRTLAKNVSRNDEVLIDDGRIRLRVVKTRGDAVTCEIEEGGVVRSRKGINLPGGGMSVPSLTSKDHRDLELALELGVDYVALSFVRRPEDVLQLQRIMKRRGSRIPIIAKIEKPQAIDNLDGILAVSDGIMVARGDLGVEMSPEEVPVLQKRIIRKCRDAGLPVVTATQMLESMIHSSRPTRAEASDVANAVYDGTDAVMLSAETAVGEYPVETVRMMDRIVRRAEQSNSFQFGPPRGHGNEDDHPSVPYAVGAAASLTGSRLGARAIAVFTQSGGTARVVSRNRPRIPIYAFTPIPEVLGRLSLLWGVEAWAVDALPTTDEMVERVVAQLRRARRAKRGDLLVVTAGTPVHQPGTTNFLKFHTVGS